MIKQFDEFINEAAKFDVRKLAEFDEDFMGDAYRYYISKKTCTIDDWIEAGLQWAQDELDNENLSDDEYEDAVSHYKYFEYDS